MTFLDTQGFYLINQFAGHFSAIDSLFVFIATFSPFLLGAYLLWLFFKPHSTPKLKQTVLFSGISFVLAEIFAKLLGLFYTHPQPFATLPHVHQLIAHRVDNAFPSDHTLLFFSILGFLFWDKQIRPRWRYLAIASLVGFSRIWVGVHYPIDVLVAAFIGLLSSYILLKIDHFWTQKRTKSISAA